MQTEDALDFQAKLGEQGMAERREQQRRKDYVANQAYSLLCLFSYGEAIICCNSGLALSQRFREETRRELESRTIRHTSVHFQIGLLANSWKLIFTYPIISERLVAAGHFGILPLRVLALMRLNRRVLVGRHGGVRGWLFI